MMTLVARNAARTALRRALSSASAGPAASFATSERAPRRDDEGGQEQRQQEGEEQQQQEEEKEVEVTRRLFEAALPHVRDLGWSREALEAAATDLGVPETAGEEGVDVGVGVGSRRPPIDLVHYFIRRSNAELARDPDVVAMLTRGAEQGDGGDSVHGQALVANRVKTVARARLNMLAPYLEEGHWLQAMAMGALPDHAEGTGRLALETVDEIWHVAGDRSVDAKWYTRRLGLLPGYCATELFMLTDESPDREETWHFLEWHVDALFGNGSGTTAAAAHPNGWWPRASGAAAGWGVDGDDGGNGNRGDVPGSSSHATGGTSSSRSAEGGTDGMHQSADEGAIGEGEVPPTAPPSSPLPPLLPSSAASATMLDTATVAAKGFGGLVVAMASMVRDVVQERR